MATVRRMRISPFCQRLFEAWTSWRSTRHRESRKFAARLEVRESLDLKSGWNLSNRREQQRARALFRSRAPLLVICSLFFDLMKFNNFQNLNKAMNGPEGHEKFAIELEQAKAHVRFCVELMREQLAAGRHFLFEHRREFFGCERINECMACSRLTRIALTRRPRSPLGF